MKRAWLLVYFATLIWSAIEPKDHFTWFLEVAPALVGLVVIWATYKQFLLTRLTYILILIHCIILMVGGHYTYAEVPGFDNLAELFGWGRNNYDKVGHFAQGFIPAMISREVVIRKDIISRKAWRDFFVVSFCLALSAFYELIEWWVALLTGASAEAFLATQGYVWDTQSDIFLALLGAVASLLTLSKIHDRQLAEVIEPA